MCGLAGFWSPNTPREQGEALAERMAATLRHRGPDDAGTWCDPEAGYSVAHRRLSVLDLSPAGHQPMVSSSGRWVIAYNGEIYNHVQLRKHLEQSGNLTEWRGHSDTETLLACIECWGLETALKESLGMFAFALWDRQERNLILARDRMGEKPLYYGWQSGNFLFGSELSALRAHPSFNANVSRDALTLLLRHNCIPAPYSIYEDIYKLPPGNYLKLLLGGGAPSVDSTPKSYWRMNDVVESGLANPFAGSESEAISLLENQLSKSIRAQMLADVPLGAFLSGGIDSSTVVALMQAQSDQPVKTFTIGFAESDYDEAASAKEVAEHLGTDHTELYLHAQDALDVIPSLPSMYSEPFADSSQIPTYLISKLASKHVTVALSGDGGDELFAGYNRYLSARKVWEKMRALPAFARSTAAAILRALPPVAWDRTIDRLKPILPKIMRVSTPGEKAHKLADVLTVSDESAYFRQLTSHWNDPAEVVTGAQEPATLLTNPDAWPQTDCFEYFMMAMDAQTYMPDDILVKVDRAAMANSLETRVPLLDHNVVELAWRMPLNTKIRSSHGKWLLRQVLNRHVPKKLIERPKMGFAIPLDSWLRGPLRDWAESLLDEQKLAAEGYFESKRIRDLWADHLSGRRNRQYHLWTVLMFQTWLEQQDES